MFFKKCASLELNPCETLPSALRSNLDMCALMCCKLLRSAELLHTSNWTALNYICLKVTSATKLIVHCTRDFEIIIFHLLPKKNDSKQLLRIQMTGYYEPAVLYADDPCVDPARCYCRNGKKKNVIFSSSVPVHFEFFLVKKLTAASALKRKEPQSTLLSSGPILYHRRLT